MQDATGWGTENFGKYLLDNNGDPYGVFDPAAVSRFLEKARIPGAPGVPGEGGWEAQPDTFDTNAQFTEFTLPQLQAYLTKTRERPSDPWAAAFYDMTARNNDLMWMPEYRDVDGKPVVSWGKQNSEGGFLDKITPFVENALALSGFAAPALGASIAGAAGAGAGALEAAGAFGGEALGAAANAAGAFGGSVAPWTAGAAAGAGAASGIDWSAIDEAINNLGQNAWEAENLGTAASVAEVAGTTLPTLPRPPTPPIKDLKDTLQTASNAVGLATAAGALGEAAGNAGDDPYASIRADELARQDRITKSVADIRGQFGRFDDNYLKGVSSSYLDYYLPQFNEQAKEARRQTVFATPSAGTSAFARRAGQLETDIGRQEANIRSQAQQHAQTQKAKLANQEETLVSQAEGAGGIADAGARAASAADIASTPEPFSPLGQLFAAYTGNVANASLAERQGYAPTGIVPNIFSRPGGRQPVQYVG